MTGGSQVTMLVAALLLGIVAAGCEDPIATGQIDRRPQPTADAGKNDDEAELPKVDFQEAEFLESSRSRDPFRPYSEMLAADARDQFKSQRAVILEQFSIDELKLTGIVGRIPDARALIVDPNGKGHTVKRGQFIGRAEIVQTGGVQGTSHELNWRVDRIRENDVVLVREDPASPDVPSATRVIPLRDKGEEEALLDVGTN